MSDRRSCTETATKPRRKWAAIYREAARLIEVGERTWSCCAVEHAILGRTAYVNTWSAPTQKYRETFGDSGGHLGIGQFDEDGDGENVRILALCFMAAMVEAGDA